MALNCIAGVPGITLHTSEDGGAKFKAACLPVALRVSPDCWPGSLATSTSPPSTQGIVTPLVQHSLWQCCLDQRTQSVGIPFLTIPQAMAAREAY